MTEEKQELNVKTERKPFEKTEKARMEIKAIEVTADNKDFVTQVRFIKVDESSFTWKPKKRTETETKHRGLPVVKKDQELITLEELPEKLYNLNNYLNDNGKIMVVTDYTTMNTQDKEGENVSYDFINTYQFEEMYFIDKDEVKLEI